MSEVVSNLLDVVIVMREGLMGGWDGEDLKSSIVRVDRGMYRVMDGGDNMKEGVLSFVERRKVVWKDSKL